MWGEYIYEKKIALILCLIFVLLVFTGCGQSDNSPEGKSLSVIKKYMTAIEQNDSATMLKCYDPALQGTAEGLTNALGNMFGIGDAYDLGASAGGYIASEIQKALGLSIELDFVKVLDKSFNKNDGHMNVQYTLGVIYQGQRAKADISINFDMVKNKDDWYIRNADEAVMLSESELVGN